MAIMFKLDLRDAARLYGVGYNYGFIYKDESDKMYLTTSEAKYQIKNAEKFREVKVDKEFPMYHTLSEPATFLDDEHEFSIINLKEFLTS